MKVKCACGKMATWSYMPQHEEENLDFCDTCVPRGCSCNDVAYLVDGSEPTYEQLYDDDTKIIYIQAEDTEGRHYPCCEYWYDEEGWDDETKIMSNL